MSAPSTAEKIAALEAKRRRLEARIRTMRASESRERRRRETRAKIIVGALLLRHRSDLIPALLRHAPERDREVVRSVSPVADPLTPPPSEIAAP